MAHRHVPSTGRRRRTGGSAVQRAAAAHRPFPAGLPATESVLPGSRRARTWCPPRCSSPFSPGIWSPPGQGPADPPAAGWRARCVTAFPPAAAAEPGPRAARGQDRDRRYRAALATSHRVAGMAAQLVWTLTSPAYSRAHPGRQAEDQRAAVGAAGPPRVLSPRVPACRAVPPAPEPVLPDSTGAVRMFGQQAHSVAVPGQAGTGEVPLSKIAVSGTALPGRHRRARRRDHGLHEVPWPRPRRSTPPAGRGGTTG